MKNLTCQEVDELLPDYCTGESDPETARAIELHAADCAACSREIAQWRAAAGVLRRASMQSPARDIPRIAVARQKPSRLFAVAASLAIVFFLGTAAGRWSARPASPGENQPSGDSLVARYKNAAIASPGTSSLGLALLSLARRE
ncbi:MAG: zf-HC2 domain-containing protein [Phycisphaerales bacterium]|nr:zf-HC2 domain-containing protein [Planctomycetota bacterium]